MPKREIKFRAWDATSKKMWWPDAIAADGRNIALVNEFGVHTTDTQHDILMQFTGLHDKDGKEIYEGDIVRHAHGDFEVSWLNVGWTPFMSWHSGDQYEVIGNIYENPELIAQTHV